MADANDNHLAPDTALRGPEPEPALPDYLISPNAVFDDQGVVWRYGKPPDYSKTRKVWAEGNEPFYSFFLAHKVLKPLRPVQDKSVKMMFGRLVDNSSGLS